MSKSATSPTARLLQSSRLFSLPRALPVAPSTSPSHFAVTRRTDAATAPYPTHQAIETPFTSQQSGDWGLKRSLPLKITNRGGAPKIRVLAQDTADHVTNFESARDHERTLAKFNEMNLPIYASSQTSNWFALTSESKTSIFEKSADNARPGKQSKSSTKDSPWLAGLSQNELDTYMAMVRGRRSDWEAFVSNWYAQNKFKRAQAERESDPTSLPMRKSPESYRPGPAQLASILKRLRDEHREKQLNSTLTTLLVDFLKLAGIISTSTTPASQAPAHSGFQPTVQEPLPLTTHPSAGIGYLRSNANMENHPIHGPQARRSPVLSRVLRPRNSHFGNDQQAKIGVGGFVTNDPKVGSGGEFRKSLLAMDDPDRMVTSYDTDIQGGNKLWVDAEFATVDEAGRVHVNVTRADSEAIAVKTDAVEDILERKRVSRTGTSSFSQSSPSRPSANFGSALPDLRPGIKQQYTTMDPRDMLRAAR